MNENLISKVTETFYTNFGRKPDYIIYAPGRINIIGEHTDYSEGLVMPAAIDKALYLAIGKEDLKKTTLVAAENDEKVIVDLHNLRIQDIPWANYIVGVTKQFASKRRKFSNFNLVFDGDIPIGAGLSSSAALSSGFAFALDRLFETGFSRIDMARIAQTAEHKFIGVQCGIMDQMASLYGRSDSAILLDCKNLERKFLRIDMQEHVFVLFDSKVKHNLADTAYNDRKQSCQIVAQALRLLYPNMNSLRDADSSHLLEIKDAVDAEHYEKAKYVVEENLRVLAAHQALQENDLAILGFLMKQTHVGLRDQYKVSCPELDFLVDEVSRFSAVYGARMMGGGFGGCTINIIEKSRVDDIFVAVAKTYKENFGLDLDMYSVKLGDGTMQID